MSCIKRVSRGKQMRRSTGRQPGSKSASRPIDKIATCRIQNPDIPWAGWFGAPSGAAGRGRARCGANRNIPPGNKGPQYHPKNRKNVARMSPQKHKQRYSYVTEGGTKSTVYHRFITSLYAGRKAFFVPAADQWNDALLSV